MNQHVSFLTGSPADEITRPANTTQYAAGDVISNAIDNRHFIFRDCLRPGVLTGSLDALVVACGGNETTKPELELWLFKKEIAKVADNSAFAPTDAELRFFMGKIDIPSLDWDEGVSGTGGNSTQTIRRIQLPVDLNIPGEPNPGNDIYGQLVVRNAYTPVSGEFFRVTPHFSKD